MVMAALLPGLLLVQGSKSSLEEMDQTEETSFLAQPPITASTPAPDVASALAALKAAQQEARQVSQPAPLPPPVASSSGANALPAATKATDGKETSGSVLPESPVAASTASVMTSTESEAAPALPAARGMAADLMALLGGAKPKPATDPSASTASAMTSTESPAAAAPPAARGLAADLMALLGGAKPKPASEDPSKHSEPAKATKKLANCETH